MDSIPAMIPDLACPSCVRARVSAAVCAPSGRKRGKRVHRAPARRGGSGGEPLVLLHPFGLCSEVWAPIVPALGEHHTLFPIAIPGHHGSDPLPPDYKHSIERAVDVLEAKLDALGLARAHLVGNSLGGWLAIELARRARASSVVALAPGGGWELGSPEHRRLVRRFQVTRALLWFGGPLAMRLTRWAVCRTALLRDAVASPERLTREQARFLLAGPSRCAAYAGVVKAMPTQPPSPPFARIPCPIRLVWGEKDRLLPVKGYSERWRRVLPGADWVVLPNVGHVQMYDDPDAVARSILGVTAGVTAAAPEEERLAS